MSKHSPSLLVLFSTSVEGPFHGPEPQNTTHGTDLAVDWLLPRLDHTAPWVQGPAQLAALSAGPVPFLGLHGRRAEPKAAFTLEGR